jgi:hypothetical protein
MHFHLPKPLHGWRAFAGEVGIIVLGVLIALAAEEFVRTIVTRRDANALRQSMVDELAMDRARWEANVHDVPCALKRLEEVRDWAGRPGSDRLDGFDPPAFWTMHDSAWQIARSSPVMTALPLKERDALADLYFVIGVQERILENAQNTSYRVRSASSAAGCQQQLHQRAVRPPRHSKRSKRARTQSVQLQEWMPDDQAGPGEGLTVARRHNERAQIRFPTVNHIG